MRLIDAAKAALAILPERDSWGRENRITADLRTALAEAEAEEEAAKRFAEQCIHAEVSLGSWPDAAKTPAPEAKPASKDGCPCCAGSGRNGHEPCPMCFPEAKPGVEPWGWVAMPKTGVEGEWRGGLLYLKGSEARYNFGNDPDFDLVPVYRSLPPTVASEPWAWCASMSGGVKEFYCGSEEDEALARNTLSRYLSGGFKGEVFPLYRAPPPDGREELVNACKHYEATIAKLYGRIAALERERDELAAWKQQVEEDGEPEWCAEIAKLKARIIELGRERDELRSYNEKTMRRLQTALALSSSDPKRELQKAATEIARLQARVAAGERLGKAASEMLEVLRQMNGGDDYDIWLSDLTFQELSTAVAAWRAGAEGASACRAQCPTGTEEKAKGD